MYAIIQDRGRQYQVKPGDRIVIDRRNEVNVGATFDCPVLLVSDDAGVTVGTPVVADRKAVLKVVGHHRGPKVIVGTYKRRKNERKRIGHRTDLTTAEVVSVA